MAEIRVPKSEREETKGLTKWLYKLMGWLGLTSGIGVVAVGGWWVIWCLGSYLFVQPSNVIQQSVHENYFNQAELGAILVALGVIIMELKRLEGE
jgi:hypothetical protein